MEVHEGQARSIGVDCGDAFHGHASVEVAGQGRVWTLVTHRVVHRTPVLGQLWTLVTAGAASPAFFPQFYCGLWRRPRYGLWRRDSWLSLGLW
jgi:hypothetical protein